MGRMPDFRVAGQVLCSTLLYTARATDGVKRPEPTAQEGTIPPGIIDSCVYGSGLPANQGEPGEPG